MRPEERSELLKELTRLADLMETCEYGDKYYWNYVKEYRRIAKLVYPEKPSK